MLLGRLSNWLENDALWTEVDGALDARFAGAILRAILAHLRYIEVIQLRIAWEHFVYAAFRGRARSPALDRRREVTLALGRAGKPVPKRAIPDLSTNLARRYAKKTRKTLTRDMSWLVKNDLLEKRDDHYRARIEAMQMFRPAQA